MKACKCETMGLGLQGVPVEGSYAAVNFDCSWHWEQHCAR